ncbi:MAG TPA: hypothetical protein EYG03_03955, partial [Planctomycetes bacterium]|nr:hypothetical protein [Planctomycetota bacterium]
MPVTARIGCLSSRRMASFTFFRIAPMSTKPRSFWTSVPGSHGRGGDNGMFAVAFHPQFKSNGEFFVVYTTQAAPKSTVVSRFRISDSDPNQANADSEEEILRIRQPWADHNAACVAFGPDNMLYIALGDGGYNTANGNAQDTSTLLGSMLRIDVDHRENG